MLTTIFSTWCAIVVYTAGAWLAMSAARAAEADAGTRPPILESEVSDVAVLAPTGPHRLLLGGALGGAGIKVINGDTARLEGQIQAAPAANFVIDPNNRYFYVAETMWTRLNRGTRQDLLSVYDAQLKLVTEITLPGRLISVPKSPTLDISSDGKLAYVYNMQPAASVAVVDLVSRKTANVVEIPGCGMVYPWGPTAFASLCADGTLAYVTKQSGKFVVRHTPRFFDGENDPVFEESLVDRHTGRALFISYAGMVYPAQLGDAVRVSEPWSLQEAAGLPRASLLPEHLAWRPGGGRMAAYHRASNRLFVLMHAGVHWSHKDPGTEIWVFDTQARKRTARFPLATNASLVTVTQDDKPLLFVVGGGFGPGAGLSVLDPQTGQVLRGLPGVSGSIAAVAGY
jgi:methylamine dehydrogenase heavy chain